MTTGTLTLPEAGLATDDDPWKRAYFRAPPFGEPQPVSFPLEDVRDKVFADDGGSRFLTTHGFTAVKHTTRLDLKADPDDPDTLEEVYFPEIKDIIQQVTGASEIFITNILCRRSPSTEAGFAQPKGTEAKKPTAIVSRSGVSITPFTLGAPPARLPHLDYTPLGARQVIRSWTADIHAAAQSRAIIAAEDALCAAHGVSATDARSDPVVARGYAGRRYAAFSVWRPLGPVRRDPMAMLPAREYEAHRAADGESPFVVEHYLNRVPGEEALGGDFLRQLGMLKVQKTDKGRIEEAAAKLKWYYVSDMTEEEVLIIKFFDSAALGEGAQEAAAPIHGSPDIGDAASGPPRASIETRLVAFW